MNKGEIWLANLDPTIDKEQKGLRPVVIISGNTMNNNFDLVIVCPITKSNKKFIGNIQLIPDEINGLTYESEVLVFQIRTIAKSRLIKILGKVTIDIQNTLVENINKIFKY